MQAVVLAKNGSSAESRVTDSLEGAGLEERAIRFTAGNQRSRNVWYTRNLWHYVKPTRNYMSSHDLALKNAQHTAPH